MHAPWTIAVLLTSSVAWAESPGHTLADYQAAMERSKITYKVAELAPGRELKSAAVLWPEGHARDCPDVRVVAGKRQLVDCGEVAAPAKPALAAAERLFKAKDWDGARNKYEESKRLSPSSWFLDLYIGDCFLAAAQPTEALAAYDRAVAAAPNHYRGHLYRADALVKLMRFDEAREALIDTLTLRPRNPTALSIAHGEAARLGIVPYDQPFAPHAAVYRVDAEHIRLEADKTPHWIAFAICKAYWLGEMPKTSGWTNTQDYDCLANLIAAYQTQKAKVAAEPQLDRLSDLAFHHQLDLFVVYEIASRIMPDVALQLDDDTRAKLRTYVAQYVLPRAIRR